MMEYKGVELTPEQFRVAMGCETPEELMAACRQINIEITKEEAERAIERLAEIDLTPEQLQAIAGGYSWKELREDVGGKIREICVKAREISC